jgi:GR25 family glycosyltransferase involved in LPS biosynthesis
MVADICMMGLCFFFGFIFSWHIIYHTWLETFTSTLPDVVVYWINLDHREDRRKEMEQELAKLQLPPARVIRVSGIYEKTRGHLGCSKSHIHCLETYLRDPHRATHCIIFEDDFEFTVENPTNKLREFIESQTPYDVCMLAGNVYQETDWTPTLHKVTRATTTSGYMVHSDFAPTLLENFKEGARLLENSYEQNVPPSGYNGEYAVDQYWFSLQSTHRWFVFFPKLGKQRASFSDIMQGNVNYHI